MLERIRPSEDLCISGLSPCLRRVSFTTALTVDESGDGEIRRSGKWRLFGRADTEARGVAGVSGACRFGTAVVATGDGGTTSDAWDATAAEATDSLEVFAGCSVSSLVIPCHGPASSGADSGDIFAPVKGGNLEEGTPLLRCMVSGFVTPSAKLTRDAREDRREGVAW
jgi:hypothetical protein